MAIKPNQTAPSTPTGAVLSLLVCPLCKGPLQLHVENQANLETNTDADKANATKSYLVCPADKLAFPIRDGIPIMLLEEAVPSSTLRQA